MNENLFTFPGSASGESGENAFDLGNFADLSGDDPDNPFADLLEDTSAETDIPADEADHVSSPDEEQAEASGTNKTSPTAVFAGQSVKPREAAQTAFHPEQPAPQANTVPQASAAAEPQAKTPPADDKGGEDSSDDAQAENPLMAALNRQEERNARKAAEPIFAQLPIFSYNGTEEPIENTEQTFEELRLAKADDFPEFDEAQNLKWSVTYGKITKQVAVPRKTKIGQFKREIETSKDFIAALKKASDKHPKCLVKPVISMQKKGEACVYKGAFVSLADARASRKTITFIPARDGKIYERRITDAGEFITPVDPPANITVLDDVRPGFLSALPRIPYDLVEQALGLFRALMETQRPLEALVHIYWDKQEQRYFIHVPRQTVSCSSVDACVDDEELQDSDRYIHYADLHSHNRMPAVFSRTDDRDERANRVYLVAGHLDRYYPELSARVCNGGRFLSIDPALVLERPPVAHFPVRWLKQIRAERGDAIEVAA